MIIPIRCFSCNKPIAHLWEEYSEAISKDHVNNQNKSVMINKNVSDIISNKDETIEKKTLDKLNLLRYCCRRMILTHVDLCEKI